MRVLLRTLLCSALVVVAGAASEGWGKASLPSITSVNFSAVIPTQGSGSGAIHYENAQGGVAAVQFDVVDGRFHRTDIQVATAQEQGRVPFSLNCTPYSQKISLRVTLKDKAGHSSEPRLLSFQCGQPQQYNLAQELARQRATKDAVRVHFFILDDGVTALTEGAVPTDSPHFNQPSPLVLRAIQERVIPALTGVWDQCALAFEAGLVRVVQPASFELSQGTLADALFSRHEGEKVFMVGAPGRMPLGQMYQAVRVALAQEDAALAGPEPVVFVTGSRILASNQGKLEDIEGFSDVSQTPYVVVRWGAAYEQGGDVTLPKQMIATLAHELGHQLGLAHPGSDGLADTANDELNLMKGSGVTPEPRANLLPSQCQAAQAKQARLVQAAAAASGASDASPAQAQWLGLQPEQTLTGKAMLQIATSGFKDLQQFGFAEFTYSPDGEKFFQISIDRNPADGFRWEWDTQAVPNGRYLLQALVVDAQRQHAYAQVWINVKN